VEAAVHAHARAAEARIAEVLGPRGFSQLRTELEKVFAHVVS
jgi:hypothetical protein